jgi:hypothetical protein
MLFGGAREELVTAGPTGTVETSEERCAVAAMIADREGRSSQEPLPAAIVRVRHLPLFAARGCGVVDRSAKSSADRRRGCFPFPALSGEVSGLLDRLPEVFTKAVDVDGVVFTPVSRRRLRLEA